MIRPERVVRCDAGTSSGCLVDDGDGIAFAGRGNVDFGDTGGTVEVFTGRTFGMAVGRAVGLSSHSGRSCVVSVLAERSLKEIFLGQSNT